MSFSTQPILGVSNVTIYQDRVAILSDVNFDIHKGEFVFMVGRTGSGKSSLLKTIYADLPLQQGNMNVAGFNLSLLKSKKIHELRRKLGIIFQDFQLFQDRSVAENLDFVMKATGWKDKAKIKTRQAEVLMKVGLGAVGNKMPYQLSGGEQQRIVVARALLNEPAILLADEPTGNLDPEVSEGIFDLFRQINSSGTAVLMATHDYNLIEKHPARVLRCDNGKVKDSKTENQSA